MSTATYTDRRARALARADAKVCRCLRCGCWSFGSRVCRTCAPILPLQS